MLKIGMIGVSDGNGHPYSFSAIFNGYDDVGMAESGWSNIYTYLKARDMADFGIFGAEITHIWTQDINESKRIARASKIKNVVENYEDMVEHVDAVVIGRDDWRCHKSIASIFLEADKCVFIDKPLSLDMDEILYFEPYLKNAKLMSCSGIRYSPELDSIRRDINNFGDIKLVKGTVVKGWEKYGIHMLEGIFSAVPFTAKSIRKNICKHDSFAIETEEGFIVEINCLGNKAPLSMRIEFYSDTNYFRADCLDAFSAFKRTMQNFVLMIQNSKQPIDPNQTVELMRVLSEGMKL